MSKKKKKAAEEEVGGTCPFWMLTYGDAMSLLLTFFVMLVSFTSFDEMKVGGFIGSLKIVFGGEGFSESGGKDLSALYKIVKSLAKEGRFLTYREQEEVYRRIKKFKSYLKSVGEHDLIEFINLDKGLAIRIQEELVFEKGSATLKPSAKELLKNMVLFLMEVENPLIIEGHTDSTKPRFGSPFKDNEELSFARASAVAGFLSELGIAEDRINVAGFADKRPLVPNDTEENRAKNRRVEIIIVGRMPNYRNTY